MGFSGRYTVELCAGGTVEYVIDSDDCLHTARALYQQAVTRYPGRLVMLCDRARVLARSDRPDMIAATRR
jgi:hypothetical protein